MAPNDTLTKLPGFTVALYRQKVITTVRLIIWPRFTLATA